MKRGDCWAGCGELLPSGGDGRGRNQGLGGGGGYSAEKLADVGHRFGELELAAVEVGNVTGEVFNFGEVMGGEEDRGLGCQGGDRRHEVVADKRVETAEGLVEDEQARVVGEGSDEGGFHAHAAREAFEASLGRQVELAEEAEFEGAVPAGIEGAEVGEEGFDGHPVGEFLVFADVADGFETLAAQAGGGVAEEEGFARGGAEEVHEELDEGGLAGAVGAHEGVDGTFGDLQGEGMQGVDAAEALGEGAGFEGEGQWVLQVELMG